MPRRIDTTGRGIAGFVKLTQISAYTRSAFRSTYNPDVRDYGLGIRAVLSAP